MELLDARTMERICHSEERLRDVGISRYKVIVTTAVWMNGETQYQEIATALKGLAMTR